MRNVAMLVMSTPSAAAALFRRCGAPVGWATRGKQAARGKQAVLCDWRQLARVEPGGEMGEMEGLGEGA